MPGRRLAVLDRILLRGGEILVRETVRAVVDVIRAGLERRRERRPFARGPP